MSSKAHYLQASKPHPHDIDQLNNSLSSPVWTLSSLKLNVLVIATCFMDSFKDFNHLPLVQLHVLIASILATCSQAQQLSHLLCYLHRNLVAPLLCHLHIFCKDLFGSCHVFSTSQPSEYHALVMQETPYASICHVLVSNISWTLPSVKYCMLLSPRVSSNPLMCIQASHEYQALSWPTCLCNIALIC